MLWIKAVTIIMSCACAYRPHVDVKIKQGIVRGYRVNSDPPYYEFIGIPYAEAPVKTNRFMPPLPPPKWDGIFEATHKVCCPQPNGKKCDENCLVANIFVPVGVGPHPVVIHLHDGDFNIGSGATTPASRLLRDFIVITFNYRLGALGFLCLGEQNDGNFGLQDQVAAITWVYRNINNFNGDNSKITVIGSGSAAMSIHLLLTTSALYGLIHRVIIESGVSISPFSLTYEPLKVAQLALKLDNDTSAKQVYKKYKAAKMSMLIKSMAEFNITKRDELFRPCLLEDDGFDTNALARDPMIALMDGNTYKVPIMIIYTNIKHIKNNETLITIDNLPSNLQFPDDVKSKIIKLINDYYFEDTLKDRKGQMIKYVNDINTYPILKAALLHAKYSDEVVFVMEYANDRMGESILNYLYMNEAYDNDAATFITLFSNFAIYGDPTPLTTIDVPIIWPPTSRTSHLSSFKVLQLSNGLMMRRPSCHNRMEFWDKIYMTFYKSHTNIVNEADEDYNHYNT